VNGHVHTTDIVRCIAFVKSTQVFFVMRSI